ncbi:hypothetical protein SDRG_10283 [Saprolegnia diclina VS20]|uniref:N-acetyltransferase domain-containing protein n=1 Tax=Saprolegnia diclina (strain VS20) TaxID=1156394 RepID=T0RQ03_SAPDV|nr:hypothetical protein SDRG_10283 [Saprolegnia diclina VS20]EQC32087.1 hypothetical protein SDRG_10283 [Saprolegnia diclina VS20]|eukprot:XP_008614489.1 hypothetical protein SDRG_10283 [Saprolegnia diclina VS20]
MGVQFRDLAVAYDRVLVDAFYDQVLAPAFGIIPDEIEDVDTLHYQLATGNHEADHEYLLHCVLLFDEASSGNDPADVLGGFCCEYYPKSNCGLITYISTHPARDTRGRGLGRHMVNEVFRLLDADAIQHQHETITAIFLESNTDAVKDDIMVPARRRALLGTLGARFLAFSYVQPRLSPEKAPCRTLHLGVFERFLEPTGNGGVGMPAATVAAYLAEFYAVLMGSDALTNDADCRRQLSELQGMTHVPVDPSLS